MKRVLTLMYIVIFSIAGRSQTTANIEMLFPKGKSKALILSYDDGCVQDRQLVKLMNKYDLIGTFHLNANKLGAANYLVKDEIQKLFKGHEVSVHTFNHPGLTKLSIEEIQYEIVEDRKELERLVTYPVRGMAYPFGNHNDTVIDVISKLGIEYARTVNDTYGFEIPENFLKWHPTMHQFSKAYWKANDPLQDSIEINLFYKTIDSFLQTKDLAVLDIWGHSWEMGSDAKKWTETERFFQVLSHQSDVYYCKQIDLVDYIHAFRNLRFSMNNTTVFNASSLKVFFLYNKEIRSVDPGETIRL
ncbi:MAG: polysaccharide deacetylase family protein [Crocinitomicaceae bacterium]|nr:polysaccharide deacetylase family protein [Crocinitomicaceae bacterium]MBP6032701.1 polysaccharide deacetylase family protein [Crocinitomicaceae bacterium]